MNIDQLHQALLWCVIINFGVLLLWFALYVGAGGWVRRLHGRWFKIPDDRFDALHYGLMGAYELAIILFFLVPYLALHIVR
ncbi:MAG: hypothetical protein JJU33_02250 [Phycisphaerales bacterium]|nr:hypothetical protein [Phycisphaerales bacterium]